MLEPASALRVPPEGVSRFGEIPKPTVIVRMEENGVATRTALARCRGIAVSYALVLAPDAIRRTP